MAVGFVPSQIIHKFLCDHNCQLIGCIVIIAVRNIGALMFKINGKTPFISDNLYFCIPNCRKRVRHNRKPRDTGSLNALDIGIMEGKLKCFV